MNFPDLTVVTADLFKLPSSAQRKSNICSMVNFHPEAKRLMDAVQLEHIVEIGAESGANTVALLEYVHSRNAHLSTIDPADITFTFISAEEKSFSFYQTTGGDFLSKDFCAEVIFMDGDHNYETVYDDLTAIHRSRKNNKIKIVFLHDVSWPWARRDNYYDLSRIKSPHANSSAETVSPYAAAAQFNLPPVGYGVACYEGGEKNGVLTALEDFLSQNSDAWEFWRIPVIYGIGVLVCTDNLPAEEYTDLSKLMDELMTHKDLLSTLEINRIENLCLIQFLQNEINRAGDVWNSDQKYIQSANALLEQLTSQTEEIKSQRNYLEQLSNEKNILTAELKTQLTASIANESELQNQCQQQILQIRELQTALEHSQHECQLEQRKIQNLQHQLVFLESAKDAAENKMRKQDFSRKILSYQLSIKTSLLETATVKQEYLKNALDIKKAENELLKQKNHAQKQALADSIRQQEELKLIIWQRDQELRRKSIEKSSDHWRICRNVITKFLPYGLCNKSKLRRIHSMLASGNISMLSLDVFDTLLLRGRHSELKRFQDIAQRMHKHFPAISQDGFYTARALAHRLAYQTQPAVQGCREPQASAIFLYMCAILNLSTENAEVLSKIELSYEMENLRSNPYICDLVRAARRYNIPVIAVSDMYYSGNTISEMLKKLLPADVLIDKVYSSSDSGISKSAGLLFDHVMQLEKTAPSGILHIGDNCQSDCLVPFIRHGINAVWLPRSSVYNFYCKKQQKKYMKKLKNRGIINGL